MPDPEEPLQDDARIWIALDRYVAGDAQAADDAIVSDWLAADLTRTEIIEALRRIRGVVLARERYQPAPVAWERLLRRIGDSSAGTVAGDLARDRVTIPERSGVASPTRQPGWSIRAWRLATVAASLVVAASASALLAHLYRSNQAAVANSLDDDSSHTMSTPRGRRADVRLPDGTLVALAPESRVTWQVAADTLPRDVMLEGEAYFDVVHDVARPFRVHVRNTVIRDVGTRFAVRAYRTDSVVRVVVTHGTVRVRASGAAPGSGALVRAGMLSLTDAAGVTSIRLDADTAQYNAFVRGEMRFVGMPLRSVVGELARWYDVDMRLADSSIGNRRITATLGDQTLPDVLDQLSIALNLRATRTGRTVVLHGD